MQWFDWMSVGILVGVTIIQTVRGVKAGGMGLPMFEALSLIVAAVVATNLSGGVAVLLHADKWLIMTIMFLLLGVGAFLLGRWLYTVTDLSFQSLDGFFSFLFGVAAAYVFGHMVLRILIEFQGATGPIGSALDNAPVAREVFEFHWWNWVVGLLFKAKLGPEFNPDVG